MSGKSVRQPSPAQTQTMFGGGSVAARARGGRLAARTCTICDYRHEAIDPHHLTPVYQVQFHMKYGRHPTWADALAHCDDWIRKEWQWHLRDMSKWSEPRTGWEPLAIPPQYGSAAADE